MFNQLIVNYAEPISIPVLKEGPHGPRTTAHARVIGGQHTDLVITRYANRVLIVLTQLRSDADCWLIFLFTNLQLEIYLVNEGFIKHGLSMIIVISCSTSLVLVPLHF